MSQPAYDSTQVRKAAAASLIGSTIEFYDFFLYGTAAALVFPKLFFPESTPLMGTVQSFSTFAVGFLARPLGGIIFGHFGDKVGRKMMLIMTLLIMGIATALIGLVPTYHSIGFWAPILLVVLRLVQGIGIGGEWGGSVLLTVEHAPADKKGFYGSFTQMGVPAGSLLSTVIFALFSSLPDEQFLSWGWRVPFLVSFLLVVLGLFIRLKVTETPVFQKLKQQRSESRQPAIEVIRTHPKELLIACGARFAEISSYYMFVTFTLSYATKFAGIPRSVVLTGITLASIGMFLVLPIYGALSDKIGRKPVYISGALVVAIMAFPFFWMIDSQVPWLVWLAIIIAIVFGCSPMYGPQAAFFSELFSTRVRYSGISISAQVASVIAGGFPPLIATLLMAWANGKPWPVSILMIVMSAITLISLILAKETKSKNLQVTENESITKPKAAMSTGVYNNMD